MIFTLCGSAKFEPEWHLWNKRLGLMGHISFSLMTFPSVEGSKTWYTPKQKETLDLAHLAKIEESDAVLLLNKDGYLGESSMREFKYSLMRSKYIFLLEPQHYDFHYPGVWDIPGWEGFCAEGGWPSDVPQPDELHAQWVRDKREAEAATKQ